VKITPGSIVADEGEHIVLTGPINGTVTLSDGEVVDVTAPGVHARDELHAAEIAHAIGQHWADPSTPDHPDHVERLEDGSTRRAEFKYDDSHYKAAVKRAGKKG
jgi:hypothetical protein